MGSLSISPLLRAKTQQQHTTRSVASFLFVLRLGVSAYLISGNGTSSHFTYCFHCCVCCVLVYLAGLAPALGNIFLFWGCCLLSVVLVFCSGLLGFRYLALCLVLISRRVAHLSFAVAVVFCWGLHGCFSSDYGPYSLFLAASLFFVVVFSVWKEYTRISLLRLWAEFGYCAG